MTFARVVDRLGAAEPWYDVVFVVLAVAYVACVLTPRPRAGIAAAIAVVALVVARLPELVTREAVQADESGLLALATRAARHPIAWSGFDGSTSGPLDTYLLVPVALLPHEAWYPAARTIALLLHLVACAAVYGAVRRTSGTRPALLAAGGLAFFLADAPDFDLASLTTETLPMALLALAGLALAHGWTTPRERGTAAPLAALAAGALPFAKLQAAPLGALVLLAAVTLALRAPTSRLRAVAGVVVAAASLPLLVTLPTIVAGAGRNALVSYLLQSGAYVTHPRFPPPLFTREIGPALYFTTFGLLGVGAVVVALLRRGRRLADPRFAPVACAAIATGLAVWAALLPGWAYLHYVLLAAVPIAIFAGTAAGFAGEETRPGPVGAGLALALVALSCARFALGPPAAWRLVDANITDPPSLVAAVAAHAPPGSTTAVWGFDPGLFVRTGTVMATEDSNTEWQIRAGPNRAYFRDRYLREFDRARPDVFVDYVADGLFFNKLARERFDGADGFDTLARRVHGAYRLTACVAGARVFTRTDLLGPTPPPPVDPRASACAVGKFVP